MDAKDMIYNAVFTQCLSAGVKNNIASAQAQMALESFAKKGFSGKKMNAFISDNVKMAKAGSGKKAKQ